MSLLILIFEFFKIGLFSIGGGLATLPFLKAITHKYPWFTANDLMDMIAVSESTPGPMGVNSATYAGFHAAGLPGALTATFSLVLQSVWKMAKKGVVDLPTGVILVVTFAAVAFFGVSPVLMVIIATAAGILINIVRGRRA